MRIITVQIENMSDESIRIYSDDLPGLILSGKNKTAILASIEPAIKTILKAKNEDTNIRIDAIFSNGM